VGVEGVLGMEGTAALFAVKCVAAKEACEQVMKLVTPTPLWVCTECKHERSDPQAVLFLMCMPLLLLLLLAAGGGAVPRHCRERLRVPVAVPRHQGRALPVLRPAVRRVHGGTLGGAVRHARPAGILV
jgi:hypothetical protein